jgi:di/tricarboxylate transporter
LPDLIPYQDAIIVSIVLLFIIVTLYKEWIGPGFTFVIGIITLGIFGVLTPTEILAGFANEQIAVILLLLLMGEFIRQSAVLDGLFNRLFNKVTSARGFLARMTLVVAGFSAFLNNTPLVAIMMPFTYNWGKKNNIPVSKLLIPLSYAAILGGCATLIGTSTNLIVNGLVTDQYIIPGLKPLEIFDFAAVGVPMIVIGFLYMLFLGGRLLPAKKDVLENVEATPREYMVEVQIREGSDMIGKTVDEAGLRNLKGLFLVEIIRGTLTIRAVGRSTVLFRDDIMIFAGDTETIAEMIKQKSGLQLTQVGMFARKDRTEVLEIVVSHNSSLINKTVKETSFRGRFDAAIIAMHRNGERVSGKIGLARLKPGDLLLILAGEDFSKRAMETQDFYLISKVREFKKMEWYKPAIMLGGLLISVMLSVFHLVPLFVSLVVLVSATMIMKVASPKDTVRSIDFNLLIIIALSLALGTAMIKSGLADILASSTIKWLMPFGRVTLLAGIYLITTILAAYITNKAAVAIIFPISLSVAIDLGAEPLPFILVVAFAAAANFMTPIGYQTNLMVYGPGGYSFKDFFRVGAPLTAIYMVVTVVILSLMYF